MNTQTKTIRPWAITLLAVLGGIVGLHDVVLRKWEGALLHLFCFLIGVLMPFSLFTPFSSVPDGTIYIIPNIFLVASLFWAWLEAYLYWRQYRKEDITHSPAFYQKSLMDTIQALSESSTIVMVLTIVVEVIFAWSVYITRFQEGHTKYEKLVAMLYAVSMPFLQLVFLLFSGILFFAQKKNKNKAKQAGLLSRETENRIATSYRAFLLAMIMVILDVCVVIIWLFLFNP